MNNALSLEDAIALYQDREDIVEIYVYEDNKEGMKENGSKVILIIEGLVARDVNAATNYSGRTALIYASLYGYIEIVKALIEKGADTYSIQTYVNIQDKDGNTALHKASLGGHTEIVKYLIEQGALVNAQDKDGITALMRASRWGYLEVVKVLVENGALVNAQDEDGETALMNASENYRNLEVIKVLVENGADTYSIQTYVNAQDKDGRTALIYASSNRFLGVVKYLMEKGADTSQMTTVHWASLGWIEKVKESLKNSNVNDRDIWGRTALINASSKGHLEVVKYLIEKGADIHAKNNYGKTALDMAKDKKNTEVVEYLESKGSTTGVQTYTE